MYFWKTHLLAKELKEKSISEDAFKNYYIATSIVFALAYYIALLEPLQNLFALAIEATGVVIVTILGLNAAFQANGGSSGVSFLNRVVSMSFPLSIKVVVFGIILGLFFSVVGLSKSQEEWITAISGIAIQAVFFWRIVVYLRSINA